ncbi:MAG: hypothetical protein J6B94_02445 [Lachnospiraceae bacterium]|nr:hypothetical protein [Lachnospiraceae bacterium]
MKMAYETPMIAVEHYELTQTIASCDVKIGFSSEECVLNDSDATWQMKDLASEMFYFVDCDLTVENGRELGQWHDAGVKSPY